MNNCMWILAVFTGFSILSQGCSDTTKAPPPSEVHIVTFKSHEVLNSILNSTIESLVKSGEVTKENVHVYNPEGKLVELQAYVRTLNSRSTSLIIAVSTPATQATLSARHPNIPVVYSFVSNPAVLNTQNNEKNLTGIANVLDYAKGFELLKKILPTVKTVGVIYNPSEANSAFSFSQIAAEAKRQSPSVDIVAREFSKPEEISSVTATLPKVDAIFVGGDNTLVQNITLLLQVAETRRIPVFASDEGSVRRGAMAAYSIDYDAFGRKTAEIAIDVLHKKQADGVAPYSYTEGRRVVNSEALKKLGITFDYSKNGCVDLK
ncbi:MAG: ABC transporter substrate-binding protein [Planctomycetaceae bacterium]|nr:ABC transporter substrate-binding protein [Planctomycetaceae bacterium]